ncbi:MAG TPA: 3-deoxy-7-phosphoheptulonate synthase [Polyangiaceae bacterium]|nr:3-deoxy-7-phosphoheptulonate synthase [Polyangiaceae bacterium]
MRVTTNLRILSVHPLLSPVTLQEELPQSEAAAETVDSARREVSSILSGEDDRLLVVVGPCSVHDPAAAIDYAQRLQALRKELNRDLCVIMRVYFEKPRTTVGWKGLINDPRLDGTFRINEGLRTARGLLRDLTEMGMPCASEFLDPISPQFISGLISWGAIGARTTESQTHRELASGLSMPIGFKNGTTGNAQIAMDAVLSSSHPHHFLGVTEQGLAAIVSTSGNPDCHVILRGGSDGPNYHADKVENTAQGLLKAGLRPCVMVDASHGNSSKDHKKQRDVVHSLAEQLSEGQRYLIGVMLESFLIEGNQKLVDKSHLRYGQSITDACLSWDDTEPLLRSLAQAVNARRASPKKPWRH